MTDIFLRDKQNKHDRFGHYIRCNTIAFVFEGNKICYLQDTFYTIVFDNELFQFKCYDSQEFADTFLAKGIPVSGVTYSKTKNDLLQIRVTETIPVTPGDIILRKFRFYKDRLNPDFIDTLDRAPSNLPLSKLRMYTDVCYIEGIDTTNTNVCLGFNVLASRLRDMYPFIDDNLEGILVNFPIRLKNHTGVVEVLRWYTRLGKEHFHGVSLTGNMFTIDAAIAHCEYEIVNPNLKRALVTEALFNK